MLARVKGVRAIGYYIDRQAGSQASRQFDGHKTNIKN